MPNLLRFPIVLIVIFVAGLWILGSRDRSPTNSFDQRDRLVLRVDAEETVAELAQPGQRRATIRAKEVSRDFGPLKSDDEPKGKLTTRSESRHPLPSNITQARIVGLRSIEDASPATSPPPQQSASERHVVHETVSKVIEQPMVARSPSGPSRQHRIIDGDDLKNLAMKYLSDPQRHMEIFEANRDKLTSPDLLPIGETLVIPPR